MKKKILSLKGFSLIELLIVLAIIILLIAVGWYSMMSFRNTLEVKQGTDEILAMIKETQNRAKNNTLPKDFDAENDIFNNVIGIQITVNGTELTRKLCKHPREHTEWTNENINCWEETEDVRPGSSNSRLVFYDDPENTGFSCTRIIFDHSTGKIYAARNINDVIGSSNNCYIYIKHIDQDYIYSRILIDAARNQFKLEE